jgi:hypothetical protein
LPKIWRSSEPERESFYQIIGAEHLVRVAGRRERFFVKNLTSTATGKLHLLGEDRSHIKILRVLSDHIVTTTFQLHAALI